MSPAADLGSLASLPARVPFVRRVLLLDETTSTNDDARRLAAAGAPPGTIVIAEAQSAGRGCFGRAWHSPPGLGIHLSVVVRPAAPPAEIPRWTLGAAVAACEACRSCGVDRTSIAWPNDLVFGRRKLGGILVEARTTGVAVHDLIVGLGINVGHRPPDFPPELRHVACSLRDAASGPSPSRADLIERFLSIFSDVSDALSQGHWASVARRWTELTPDASGARVRVRRRTDGAEESGTTRGIDDSGALRVDLDLGGRVLIRHGDAVAPAED